MAHPGEGRETWKPGSGALAVRPAEFAGIEHACEELLQAIARIRALAVEVGEHAQWGLGEGNARLISASTLVARLRSLAGAKEHSIASTLDAHSQIVADIQQSFRGARDRLVHADETWASRINYVESTAGQSVPTPRELA